MQFQQAFSELPGVDVDPQQALLRELQQSAAVCSWLRATISQVDPSMVAASGLKLPAMELLADFSDRVGRLSSFALRAGLDERAIAAAEVKAEALLRTVVGLLDSPEAGLNRTQQVALRGLLATALLDGPEVENPGE